jgi:anaerobic selenocysteine-containing dehydrogenase
MPHKPRRDLAERAARVSAARRAVEARGETFYQGPSAVHLAAFPPKKRWDDWVELDSRSWPRRVEHRYMLIPTTCFNCESACGLLAYVDRDDMHVRKFEGNPEHPGSRGRNCAKDQRQSTRSPTPTASCTRSSGPDREALANGSG